MAERGGVLWFASFGRSPPPFVSRPWE